MARLYQVYDRVAGECHGPVVVEVNDGPAIRMFHQICQDARSLIGQHPADFELWCLGDIDNRGRITPVDVPVTVATGHQWAEGRDRAAVAAKVSEGLHVA